VKPQRRDLVAKPIAPDYALGAHTASLGLAFYSGKLLPERYLGGAFTGQHGSWNRNPLSGYKVIFVPFADGRPSGMPEDILTGFVDASGDALGLLSASPWIGPARSSWLTTWGKYHLARDAGSGGERDGSALSSFASLWPYWISVWENMRWTLGITAVLAALLLAYAIWPVAGFFRIASTIEARDAAALAKLVDFRAL
jgi:hypothetical protein